MAIVTPGASMVITPAEDLIFQQMEAEPLKTALTNVNWLYLNHQPRLVGVAPSQPSALARNAVVVAPITPSAEAGMRYDFRTTAITSANTNLTVTVEYCTAYTGLPTSGTPTAWTNIFTQVTATTAAAVTTQHKATQAIPSTAVALRWTVAAAAGTFELHHLHAAPVPSAVASGVQASGFAAYDDGLFDTVSGAPVHTELLNRCKRSTLAIMRDRRIMVASVAGDEAQANCRVSETDKTAFAAFATLRLVFPWQSDTVAVSVQCLATVSAGSGTGLVKVSQVASDGVADPAEVVLDASAAGAIDSDTLSLTLQGDGPYRWADVAISMKTTAGNTTYLHSLAMIYRPGD